MTSTVQSLLLSSMEQNNKPQDEDRLGALTDDILLSILGSVDLATAARTSALSTRWRSLPWLLPDLNLHVRDFLPAPCPDYPVAAGQQIYFYSQIPAQHIDEAMASLTRAARSFLRIKGSSRISRMSLEMYLIGNYSHDIGPLVRDAIDNGMIKELDLTIADDKDYDCKGGDMLRKARDVDGFFSAYPNILPCLTWLQLYNLRFAEGDIHNVLFDCCKQLQHLSLEHCDVGDCSVWQVDAPNSVLRVLEVRYSYLKRLEVLCLPKLELLSWEAWMHCEAPLHFGYVPSLKELFLVCGADLEHSGFSLSQLLDGATEIHTLTLNFQGEKLWILPESKQLRAAFSNLRKLSIHGIYVEFDLLWTINLLEAAPSVEIFDIEVFEHPCLVLYWERVGIQRVKPSWKVAGFTSCNKWKLRELHVTNFSPLMEQHMLFVREVMDRAPNLKTVILKEDDEPCKDCEAMGALPNLVGGLFPRTKNEQETIAQQLRVCLVSVTKWNGTGRFHPQGPFMRLDSETNENHLIPGTAYSLFMPFRAVPPNRADHAEPLTRLPRTKPSHLLLSHEPGSLLDPRRQPLLPKSTPLAAPPGSAREAARLLHLRRGRSSSSAAPLAAPLLQQRRRLLLSLSFVPAAGKTGASAQRSADSHGAVVRSPCSGIQAAAGVAEGDAGLTAGKRSRRPTRVAPAAARPRLGRGAPDPVLRRQSDRRAMVAGSGPCFIHRVYMPAREVDGLVSTAS